MDVLSNINRARSLWYVSLAQYSDEKALEDLNVVYKLICSIIIQNVDENYFNDFIWHSLIAWQNEYILEDESNQIDVNKISDLFVKYSETWEYIKATKVEKFQLDKDLEWYQLNTSKSNPFYFVYNNSIFIYPTIETGSSDIINWVKLNAALTPIDLILAWDEDSILLEKEYHYILSLWMLPYIFQRRWLLQEKQFAEQDYQNELTNLIIRLSDRTNWMTDFNMPNLSYYE